MTAGATYRVLFRRRRQGRTDYRLRRRLVISSRLRLITRGSLRHMTVQVARAGSKGDEILVSASSSELRKFGWRGPSGNISAAYLTGLLLGHRAKVAGVEGVIVDLGLQSPSKGTRTFAAVRGALDAGLEIACEEKILPDLARIRGEHIAKYAQQVLSSDPDRYKMVFSSYLAADLKPENLPEHFNQVKDELDKTRGGSR
jgi:large subunit ribosomal protein L18